MVNKKSVIKCKFHDYVTPTELQQKEPQPLKPVDFNYGNKLKLQEKKQ
jgi:hypothetical protein